MNTCLQIHPTGPQCRGCSGATRPGAEGGVLSPPALQAGGLLGGAQSSQLTCAETSVPSLPLPSSCSGPKRFRAGGSGGMLSGGHAACTGCAESSRRSRRQCEYLSAAPRGARTPRKLSRMGLSSSLLTEMFHSWCYFPLGLTAVVGTVPPPHLHWAQSHTSVASGPRDISQVPNSLAIALLWLPVFSPLP